MQLSAVVTPNREKPKEKEKDHKIREYLIKNKPDGEFGELKNDHTAFDPNSHSDMSFGLTKIVVRNNG